MVITTHETFGKYGGKPLKINSESVDKIISMLSANLYSNPLSAFLREIVSNAHDSHLEAGVDAPIIVNYINGVLSVRDFGTGLSPERMNTIYGMVGGSTKSDTNEFIGGFGIGRLSGLALSDEVSVVSYYNGRKYDYVLSKSGGSVSFFLKNEQATDQPNGVEVSVKYDVFEWNLMNEIRDTLTFFPNIISNLIPTDKAESIKVKEYEHFSVPALKRGLSVVVGGRIPYMLDSKKVLGKVSMFASFRHSNIHPKVPIGELELTPSREDIIYNDSNISVIGNAFRKAISEIKELIEKDCPKKLTSENIERFTQGCFKTGCGLQVSQSVLTNFDFEIRVGLEKINFEELSALLYTHSLLFTYPQNDRLIQDRGSLNGVFSDKGKFKIIPDRLANNQKKFLIENFRNNNVSFIREREIARLSESNDILKIFAEWATNTLEKVKLPEPTKVKKNDIIKGYIDSCTKQFEINLKPTIPTIVIVGNRRAVEYSPTGHSFVVVSSKRKLDTLLKSSENFYTEEGFVEKFGEILSHRLRVHSMADRYWWLINVLKGNDETVKAFNKLYYDTPAAGERFRNLKKYSNDPVVKKMEQLVEVANAYNLSNDRGLELFKKEFYGND